MSVSELNQLMTYVIEGWMLFSAGFTSIAFVSFVARRFQEDIEAAELAQVEGQIESLSESEKVAVTEAVEMAAAQTAAKPTAQVPKSQKSEPKKSKSKKSESKKSESKKSKLEMPPAENTDEPLGEEAVVDESKEKARLEEVAAVSEKLAKTKEKQPNASSVSVSTRPQ